MTCRAEVGKQRKLRWKRRSDLVPDAEGLIPGLQMNLEENKLSSAVLFLWGTSDCCFYKFIDQLYVVH